MTHATICELVEAGEITPRKRTTAEDLEFAATWLEAYEGDPDDDRDNLTALASVARYLRREADRRHNRAAAEALSPGPFGDDPADDRCGEQLGALICTCRPGHGPITDDTGQPDPIGHYDKLRQRFFRVTRSL